MTPSNPSEFGIQRFFSVPTTVGTMDMCPLMRQVLVPGLPNHRLARQNESAVQDKNNRSTILQTEPRVGFNQARARMRPRPMTWREPCFALPFLQLNSLPRADGDDFVDVVMASPSLEVGIDLPNVTESLMTHAVRNIASYRQKAGRVGRESNSEALNITLATDSANDLHYYRQPN